MQHGVISRHTFTIASMDFYIDLQDQLYYGEKAYKYYVPSQLNDDCWGIDFTKQFRTEQACKDYMVKCIIKTCKAILKEYTCKHVHTSSKQ